MGSTPQKILETAVNAMGGQPRSGQQEMVAEVWECIQKEEHLLVQAGTGTGKSLGYLAPLMLECAQGKKHAVVSTATIALQRQIMEKDAPAVSRAISKEGIVPPRLALLKGWNNYVCPYKVNGGSELADTLFDTIDELESGREDEPSDLAKAVKRVRQWAEETITGDRDDLIPGVPDRVWRQVSLSKRECLGEKCPYADDCFARIAREKVREADLVVTNHAILGIQAAGKNKVLPEYDLLVVDEAHQLPASVRSQSTVEVSGKMVQHLARIIARSTSLETGELESSGRALENAMRQMESGWIRGSGPENFEASLQVSETLLSALVRELNAKSRDESNLKIAIARGSANELLEALGIARCQDSSVVRSIRVDRDGNRFLNACPLEVSGSMANSLWNEHAVVLTSATIKMGGTFDGFAYESGLAFSPTPWKGVDVESPFDYSKQAIVYVASHLPPPSRQGPSEQSLRELAELAQASNGGMLALFASHQASERAAAYLRENTGLKVFAQGDDSISTLVKSFAEDENSCLVGTLSLWQGVDVPGHSCRLVVIDKIPFPRPDDPLIQARNEAATKARKNAFMSVSLSSAALLFAQGAGRLIRTASDRGMVAILDSRVATKGYGKYLLATLPPFWRTEDGKIARAALGRLSASVN
ncbi:ATP-dependent DNA helicase [Actinomycetaceae bacterium TAE3-ERU4]|nr:ATP-dependent DNA helicase [Actinomycetaceae bacterium TAE3-ERU4]